MNTTSNYKLSAHDISTIQPTNQTSNQPNNINQVKPSNIIIKNIKPPINVKKPITPLTGYQYNIEPILENDFSSINDNTTTLIFCTYRIIDSSSNNIPFLQYLLYKYDTEESCHYKKNELFVFPFNKIVNTDSIEDKCRSYARNLQEGNVEIKGFIQHFESVYVFFHVKEIIIQIGPVQNSNSLWWAIIDEICNHKKVLNFDIHRSVYNLFYRNPDLIYLKNNKSILDIPKIGFYGTNSLYTTETILLGLRTTQNSSDNLLTFTTYEEAAKNAVWKNGGNIKNDSGDIIRYIIFLGSRDQSLVTMETNYSTASDGTISVNAAKSFKSIILSNISNSKTRENIISNILIPTDDYYLLTYHHINTNYCPDIHITDNEKYYIV